MKNLAYILILLFSTQALAVIDLKSNNFSTSTSNSSVVNGTVTIWGGTAGGTSNGGATIANSCLAANFDDCNRRQVGENVEISLTFSSDQDISGTAFIKNSEGTVIKSESYTSGQTVTLEFEWGDLCASMSKLDAQCDPETPSSDLSDTADFTFGVEDGSETTDSLALKAYLINTQVNPNSDNSNTDFLNAGIVDFTAFMGDKKVYFPSVNVPVPLELFPEDRLPSGGSIVGIVAFYNQTSIETVNSASSSQLLSFDNGDYPKDSDDAAPDLDPGFIEGFANETPVFTRVALQDEAGNILGITPTSTSPCAAGNESSDPLSEIISNCQYSTVPLEVAGLLSEDVNCFIATATFGSSMDSTVKDFRAFRSQVLLKTKWGKWFVKKYYKWGSYASHFIVESPTLKKLSRIALQPAWLFAVVSLKIGFGFTLLLMLFLGTTLMLLIKRLMQRGAYS